MVGMEDYFDAVHQLAALVPPGCVLSYGDVAELLDAGGARQAGKAMSQAPQGTPWWRIVRADGTLHPALAARAAEAWQAEQLAGPTGKISMAKKRWQPDDEQFARIEQLRRSLRGGAKMSAEDDLI